MGPLLNIPLLFYLSFLFAGISLSFIFPEIPTKKIFSLDASHSRISLDDFLKPRLSLDIGPKIIGVAYSDSFNHIRGLKNIESRGDYDLVQNQILSYAVNLLNFNTPFNNKELIEEQNLKNKIEQCLSRLKGFSPSNLQPASSPFAILSHAKNKSLEIVLGAPYNVNGEFDLNIPNARLSFNLALLLFNRIIEKDLFRNIKVKLFDERFTTMEAKLFKMRENHYSLDSYSAICLLDRYIEDKGRGSLSLPLTSQIMNNAIKKTGQYNP